MATGITESDVWTAADALLLEGARPTIERVRQKIGRGSPNTVSPHLETWFRALGARIQDPRAFAAPPDVPEPIAQAAAHFWETALAAARAEQARAYEERWEELAREGQRFAAQAERLAMRETQLQERERDLQEALKVATAQLDATETRLQAAEAQLRQRDKALAVSQTSLEDARAANKALLANAEQERDRHAQAVAALDARHAAHERRWLNELDAERESVKRLQTRLDASLATAQQQADQLREALAVAQDQQRAAQQQVVALQAQAQAEQRQRHGDTVAAAQALQASQAREADLAQRLSGASAQVDGLLRQLKSRDEQFGELAARLLAIQKPPPPAPETPPVQAPEAGRPE